MISSVEGQTGMLADYDPRSRSQRERETLGLVGYGLLCSVASHMIEITYGEVWHVLTDRELIDTGDSEPGRGHHWVDPVKGVCVETARVNLANGEPLLASLVRLSDGRIGDGYVTAVEIRYGRAAALKLDTPEKIQAHADLEARLCWRYFGRNGW